MTTATLLRLIVRRRASSGLAARARDTPATPGVYAMDKSSRLRSGTFERISSLAQVTQVHEEGPVADPAHRDAGNLAQRPDQQFGVRSGVDGGARDVYPELARLLPELTSSAVTTPPACSTARVISLIGTTV